MGRRAGGGGRARVRASREETDADGEGGKVLVRAGGGWSDLLEWLARNRFWERAAWEREVSGAGDEREQLFYH